MSTAQRKRYLSSLSACATTKPAAFSIRCNQQKFEKVHLALTHSLWGAEKTFRNHLSSSRIPHPVSNSHRQYQLSPSFTLPSIYTVDTSVTDTEEQKGWRQHLSKFNSKDNKSLRKESCIQGHRRRGSRQQHNEDHSDCDPR